MSQTCLWFSGEAAERWRTCPRAEVGKLPGFLPPLCLWVLAHVCVVGGRSVSRGSLRALGHLLAGLGPPPELGSGWCASTWHHLGWALALHLLKGHGCMVAHAVAFLAAPGWARQVWGKASPRHCCYGAHCCWRCSSYLLLASIRRVRPFCPVLCSWLKPWHAHRLDPHPSTPCPSQLKGTCHGQASLHVLQGSSEGLGSIPLPYGHSSLWFLHLSWVQIVASAFAWRLLAMHKGIKLHSF